MALFATPFPSLIHIHTKHLAMKQSLLKIPVQSIDMYH